MRWIVIGAALALLSLPGSRATAGEDEDQVVQGVLSGLLGVPAQSPSTAYTAQERDRLVALLQSGEYVTSRQGEAVDLMVYGVPLTRADHVYTAKPIKPSQAR